MTSKSDPRGHPGLKLCVHVSVMGYYRFTNFRRNRRGSGSKWHFLGDFTWNDLSVHVRSRCPHYKWVVSTGGFTDHHLLRLWRRVRRATTAQSAPVIGSGSLGARKRAELLFFEDCDFVVTGRKITSDRMLPISVTEAWQLHFRIFHLLSTNAARFCPFTVVRCITPAGTCTVYPRSSMNVSRARFTHNR